MFDTHRNIIFLLCLVSLALFTGCLSVDLSLAVPPTSLEKVPIVPFSEEDLPLQNIASLHRNEKTAALRAPIYNIAQTCRAGSSMRLGTGALSCESDEKAAEIALKKSWFSFRNRDRVDCVRQTKSFNPSYVETLTCLELDKDIIRNGDAFAKMGNPQDDTTTGSITIQSKGK